MAPSFFLRHHAAMQTRHSFLLILFLLAACSTLVSQRVQRAGQLAQQAGMTAVSFPGEVPLAGYARRGNGALWVFIEGDGLAWVTPTRPSMNPTPVDPVALRLAAADPAGNVLYLARPGQYVGDKVSPQYWLDARFAPEVVAAMKDAVLDHAQVVAARELVLVGYSGGAALAVLVAAQLVEQPSPRLAGLVTVAGNLDHQRWTKALGLTPLAHSLNPADVAAQLVLVPQRHLVGTRDSQVPIVVLESYLQHAGDHRCQATSRFPLGHAGPWEEAWRATRNQSLACGG